MMLTEIFAAVVDCFAPSLPDHDRSIVGESPIEARTARIKRYIQAALAITAIACAIWYWTH